MDRNAICSFSSPCVLSGAGFDSTWTSGTSHFVSHHWAAEDSSVDYLLGDLLYKTCFWDHTGFLPLFLSWGNHVLQKLCQNWPRAKLWSARNWSPPMIFSASSPHPKHPASKCHTWLPEPSMIVPVCLDSSCPKLSSSLHLKTYSSYNSSLPDLLPAGWVWVIYEVKWKLYARRVEIWVFVCLFVLFFVAVIVKEA